jgi:hypothetical protein
LQYLSELDYDAILLVRFCSSSCGCSCVSILLVAKDLPPAFQGDGVCLLDVDELEQLAWSHAFQRTIELEIAKTSGPLMSCDESTGIVIQPSERSI